MNRPRLLAKFALVAAGVIGSAAAFLCFVDKDKVDIFAVMEDVSRMSRLDLWPGFHSEDIPCALSDGERTYLFHFPGSPKGFSPLPDKPDVLVFDGVHPAVFGNIRGRIDGVWVAVSIPQFSSASSGRHFSLQDMAAVVLHEQFHVFQAVHHPDWQVNDLVLIRYRVDTAETICVRQKEIEALRRAVAARTREDAAGWAETALALRKKRLADLGAERVEYDQNLHLQEGLAEYIQYRAAGNEPSDAPLVSGFAPKAIRELGYFEGRCFAELLDRFDPRWKDGLEAGLFRYLDERLERDLQDAPGGNVFSPKEEEDFRTASRTAVSERTLELAKIRQELSAQLGLTVVFDFSARPLSFKMFNPFAIDMLIPGEVVHRQWVVLENDRGTVEVINRPCLTKIDSRSRVTRLVVPGLSRRPLSNRIGRSLRFLQDGLGVYLNNAQFTYEGSSLMIIRVY